MTDSNISWDALKDAWQQPEQPPMGRREIRRVLRKRRLARAMVVLGELVITVLVFLAVGRALQEANGPMALAPYVVLLVLWSAATAFAWWNRMGEGRFEVRTPMDFFRISLDRARRKIRVVRFSAGLLLAQVVVGVAFWPTWSDGTSAPWSAPTPVALWFVLVAVAYVGWGVVYYRRARAEERHFRVMIEQETTAVRESAQL